MPTVLAVGGTTLTWSGSGSRSETVWSKTGGGASAYFARPSYQTSNIPGLGTPTQRLVSDVAFNADPSTGQYYSDTHPSVGCDGNLAGGDGNSGATVAQKWWNSLAHRASLYRPTFTGNTANVCIYFAMTHGGPGESASFTRAAARWAGC